MREKLLSFLPDQFPEPDAFFVELTGITYPDPRYRIDRDRSPVLCLEYVIAGRGHVEVGGRSFDPQAGDVYLLPMGLHHRYRSDPADPWKKIWMNVRGTLCADLLRAYRLGETYHVPACPLLPLFEEFVSVCAGPPADPWELERRCSLLLHDILSRVRASLSILPDSPPGPAEQARELLDRSLYEPVTVDDLAAAVGLSPSQLTRVFSARFGVTPYRYLLSRRLETARLLLRGTALPVREIAFRLCFSDEHYFSSLFRRKTGQTPSAYRRNPEGKIL
ncbi:MAG TPA: helix-turn-helix domain-containing protein [Candidatus Caccousia stercoris]|uniref:Helix-turn-helix domain-containing protein n=1 Tax=Candidatus Caccousia stercoris TaxID=2840723 RepID=A0A9D1K157_9FIRM|nr:helix-turn-helix domain-containing protein [Candidatus Caccousia stercoris]